MIDLQTDDVDANRTDADQAMLHFLAEVELDVRRRITLGEHVCHSRSADGRGRTEPHRFALGGCGPWVQPDTGRTFGAAEGIRDGYGRHGPDLLTGYLRPPQFRSY